MQEKYGLRKISLGDILREEVKKGTPLAGQLKSYMEKGLLVPDEVVAKVIEASLDERDFLLDGYPRNLNQAKTLDEIFQRKKIEIDRVIYLEVSADCVVARLSKRLVCKLCGANYHLINMPPKAAGICDACGGALYQRKDDVPEVIRKRLEVFDSESRKVLDFYDKKGKLLTVDGSGNCDQVFARIKAKFA